MAEINQETGMWEPALDHDYKMDSEEHAREATIEQLAQCLACPKLVEGEGCPVSLDLVYLCLHAATPSQDPEARPLCNKIVARLSRLN
jgi:hypothetical protein